MISLLLSVPAWDLSVDVNKNIALASDAYGRAQDVASAIRVFQGEMWYDVTVGIPYLDGVIGQFSFDIYAEMCNQTALTVPGVVTAATTFTTFSNRKLSGAVNFTDTLGKTYVLTLYGTSEARSSFDGSGGSSGAYSSGLGMFTVTYIDGGSV